MQTKAILQGVKVLDFSHHRAGPTCTMLLGDMGADVIKIEPPWGEPTRRLGARVGADEHLDFLTCNRNKRGIVLDLKTEEGRRAAVRLAEQADVLVENYRPGVLERFGLGYEDLAKRNPGLIYCSITGWGRRGPYAQRPGVDQIAQGVSGFMSFSGTEASGPLRVGVPIGDLTTGIYAALGVVAALYERRESGLGQRIDCSILESLVSLLSFHGLGHLMTGSTPSLVGNHHPIIAPMGAYEAADGLVNVAPSSEEQFQAFCRVAGLEYLLDDERFADNASRVAHRDELTELINVKLRERPKAEWVQSFLDAGIPAGPVQNLDEVFQDEQVLANDMVLEIEHPTVGRLPQLGFPIKFERTPMRLTSPPPTLGQHTEEVLTALGDDEEGGTA